MKVIIIAGRILHALQVIPKSLAREAAGVRLIGTGVQCIGRMGHNFSKLVFPRNTLKPFHVCRVDGFGAAAPGIAGKKGKGTGPQLQRLLSHCFIAFGR